jgi:hypothetical protein
MKDLKLRNVSKKISSTELKSFMNEFALKLPESYIKFILKNNGGYPEISAYDNPYEDGFTIQCFNRISPVHETILEILEKKEVNSARSTIETHQRLEKNLPDHLYPFGLDVGGNDFCISMKEDDFGAIYRFFMDGTADEPIYITDSFENFVNALEDPAIYDED